MEIVSLIIMIIGLVALVAIYVISRISRKDLPQNRKLPPINTIRDEFGEEASSILDDQPARDGKTPTGNAHNLSGIMQPDPLSGTPEKPIPDTTTPAPNLLPQLIMFVAAESEDFYGPDVLDALDNSGLSFGEMNVYHRMVLTNNGEQSLFYVANGVKPWTLVPEEMEASYTPGLSMILNLPSPIDDQEAIHDFVRTAERINDRLGGVLKNQHQQPITEEERRAFFAMAS